MAPYTFYKCFEDLHRLGFMNQKQKESKISLFIKEVCKGKTEEELLEAEENFRRLLLVIKRICDRLEREGKSVSDFDDLQNM